MNAAPPETRRRWLTALVVAVVAVGVYGNSLGDDFVWDDSYAVVTNPSIRSLTNIPSFFAEPWSAGTTDARGRSKNAGYYRPLTLVTYAVDYAIWGLDPVGFRLTNVLLHAALALLVLGIGRRLTGRDDVALVAALLFAVHATHTEAVDVVAYRTSLLAVGFVLLGVYLYLGVEARRASARLGDRRLWLWVPLAFAGGLLSKESAITLPAILLALDLSRGEFNPKDLRRRLPALLATYAPLLLIAIGYFALRAALLHRVPISYFAGVAPLHVAMTMTEVFAFDLRLLVFPWPLCPFYDWSLIPPAESLADPSVIASIVSVALYGAALVWTFLRHRVAFFLLAAYGLALLPYAHIVPFIVVAADRFLLLPSFAFAIGVAWGALSLASRPGNSRWLWWGLVTTLIVGNAALTIRRNPHWASDLTILEQTATDYPESFNARFRLGELYIQIDRLDDAERELRAAARLAPNLDAPIDRLTDVLNRQGRPRDATRLRIAPGPE